MRILSAIVLSCVAFVGSVLGVDQRPNIVWLSCEDISPHIGSFGDPHAITPNSDQLASEGVRYTNTFTTAGVCAPCRSGIITGMYQTSLGTQHMRCTATLPKEIKPFPVYLRDAGYYCTNNSKQDYQFRTPKGTWDESSGKAHWRNRPDKSQPFFSVFNFTGCHESGIASTGKYKQVTKGLTEDERQDPEKLELPPYYPDTSVVREDWKRNYELITAMDHWAGNLIQQLKDDGLYEDTIIMAWSDHGIGLPRAKRWLYDSGTHIHMVVRTPEKFRDAGQASPGEKNDQLVSSIDFGPTVLKLAGVKIPDYVQGQPFLGGEVSPREYVYGARDRMDERYDIIRMVRDKRFKYIRNYEPLKTYYQYMNTPEKGATMSELRRLHEQGQLSAEAEYYFSATKPVEELYDCQADPHEVNNLAADPKFADTLKQMRAAHRQWVLETRDTGLIPEPILVNRAKQVGSEYAVLRQADGDQYNQRLSTAATQASEGASALPDLIQAMKDEDDAVRYWAATGIGNIGEPARDDAAGIVQAALTDEASAVRTAAARAMCRMGLPEDALPVLVKELTTGQQWERLQAAIVLDEIDDQARPVIQEMKQGLEYQKGFNSDGKYRVRVTNRALNELQGTDNKIP
ncbi:sulfatase-like hydrolase/transferase [Bremerella alba]|uniref:Sulfatase N-terminal domain-containing protein n=1 Tax=Bremerella alba TaxID=980252 RepID=A0A7V8V4L0_9BACT|nr:sulfatase-like hydrolase/transferase [Bremerella alba]MBA2114641.1 hypothetical protein [Bremerella alba]